tara:strand:- start:104 stop:256 length:153 start_codon:yes stop_codon:yes gene_type:complete
MFIVKSTLEILRGAEALGAADQITAVNPVDAVVQFVETKALMSQARFNEY